MPPLIAAIIAMIAATPLSAAPRCRYFAADYAAFDVSSPDYFIY